MNGFQHLPEYVSAEQSYRRERIVVERSPRGTGDRRTRLLGRVVAALTARSTGAVRAAR